MLTNNMVSLLAKNGGSMATKLAKQAAQNPAVKTATAKQRDAVVTAVVPFVIAGGKAALRRPFANRKNRRLAEQEARQIGGTYTRAVIARDWYWVVWQDKTPVEVYPPLPEGIGPLAECRELQNYRGFSHIDPSADSS